jgi:regulatory protein
LERITEIRRRAGRLREIETSAGRTFLVLKGPATNRFLEVGTELDDRDLEELKGPIARSAGLARVYRLLAARDRSEHEIREALFGEGIEEPEVVGGIIEELTSRGFLDDRRLAAGYIRYMSEHRPSGAFLLRRKLKRRGIDDRIIDLELETALPPDREREIAHRLARGRLRAGQDRERSTRRMHGYLSRRGFGSRVVNEICAAIMRGEFTGERDEREDQNRA